MIEKSIYLSSIKDIFIDWLRIQKYLLKFW